ncbi:hypothetical protein B0H19DRAFT_1146307 [Mycena capillaripes]|nr:hypothetical protein B0H19DRAFT_1146307 [Mycena capillaripes]
MNRAASPATPPPHALLLVLLLMLVVVLLPLPPVQLLIRVGAKTARTTTCRPRAQAGAGDLVRRPLGVPKRPFVTPHLEALCGWGSPPALALAFVFVHVSAMLLLLLLGEDEWKPLRNTSVPLLPLLAMLLLLLALDAGPGPGP